MSVALPSKDTGQAASSWEKASGPDLLKVRTWWRGVVPVFHCHIHCQKDPSILMAPIFCMTQSIFLARITRLHPCHQLYQPPAWPHVLSAVLQNYSSPSNIAPTPAAACFSFLLTTHLTSMIHCGSSKCPLLYKAHNPRQN